MIPNAVFDILNTLSEKELKVLLVILRQTVGWVSKNGKRKSRDWISHRYFINKTGLSRKSITRAISLLINKKLIRAETKTKEELINSKARKGHMHIYYSCLLVIGADLTYPNVKMSSTQRKNVPATKLTVTKLKPQTKVNSTYPRRLTDFERYQQLLRESSKKDSL